MSTNLLLVSPYSLNYFGGVQNQLLLIKKFLPKEDYNLKFLCPDSPDFNLGKPIKMPFNGSVAPIALFANKKTILKAISWADVVHLHEPFIPIFFWRFPVDKRTIISHHASLSILLSLVQKKLIQLFKSLKCLGLKLNTYLLELAKDLDLLLLITTLRKFLVIVLKKILEII